MTKLISLSVVVSLFAFGAARAEAPPAASPPAAKPGGPPPMPKAGPETKALAPMVGTMIGTGTMKANSMGPGSPEMPTKTTHTCKWINRAATGQKAKSRSST